MFWSSIFCAVSMVLIFSDPSDIINGLYSKPDDLELEAR